MASSERAPGKAGDAFKVKGYEAAQSALEILIAALAGFAVAALFLYLRGYDAGTVFSMMLRYGYSNPRYLLARSTPLALTGLAFSIPQLAGVFNIGGESQFYWGAFLGLLVTHYTTQVTGQGLVGLAAGFATALLSGALWALLVGVLRVYRGVNEVIAAIMLNWFSYYIILFMLNRYFLDPQIPHQSVSVPASTWLDAYAGFTITVVTVLLVYYALYYTVLGYGIRVSGLSPKSAKYAGIDPGKSMLTSMLIGGALAGLGGLLLVLTVSHNIDTTMSTVYGYGFLGIGVGLLGRNNPLGVVVAALFVAGLLIGGQWVELLTGSPPMLSDVVVGIIVVALSFPYAYRTVLSRYLKPPRGE